MSTGSKQTTTTSMQLSPELQNAYSGLVSKANNLSGQDYTGELTAPMSNTQKGAITGLQDIIGGGNQYYDLASSLLTQAGAPITLTPFSSEAVDQYMSPYVNDVVNSTLAAMNEQYGQQRSALRGNAAAAHALGGDRAGVAEAALAGQQSLATNQTLANLYNTAYEQALGQYNQEQNRSLSLGTANASNALNAAGTYANLGSASVANQLAANSQLFNMGTVEQQTAQNADTAAYQKWLQQFNNLASIANVLGSTAGATGTQVQSTKKNVPILARGGRADGDIMPAPDITGLYARQPQYGPSGLQYAQAPRMDDEASLGNQLIGGVKGLSDLNGAVKGLGEKGGLEGLATDAGSWLSDLGTAALGLFGLHNGGAVPHRADGGDSEDDEDEIPTVTGRYLNLADAGDRLARADEVPASWPGAAPTNLANASLTSQAPAGQAEPESFWQRIGAVSTPGTGEGINYKPGNPGWGLPLLAMIGAGLANHSIGAGLQAGVGEYLKEKDLDAHPIVDNSGTTKRIYYPSEKRWVDTGLPTYVGIQQNNLQQQRADKATSLLTPEETAKLGFLPGSVVSRNGLGELKVEQSSDVASDAAMAQKINLLHEQQKPQWAQVNLKQRELDALGGTDANGNPVQGSPTDANSNSILAQTGLSYPAFLVLTGQASKLPRDKMSRSKAFNEATQFANSKGVDVSTFGSQYDAYNKVLAFNTTRQNMAVVQENEINATIDNLRGVSQDGNMGKLRWGNVQKIWAGQEVNDPVAQQYAFHLEQLRNEMVAYNLIAQGQINSDGSLKMSTQDDQRRAEEVIKKGVSSGSLNGLARAVQNSTDKMQPVLKASVRAANKGVWDLFGVGQNYDKLHPAHGVPSRSAPPGAIEYLKQHPELRGDFDKKYGAGAAKAILGN